MTLDDLVAITRRRLAARERRVVPRGPLVQAAVLVPHRRPGWAAPRVRQAIRAGRSSQGPDLLPRRHPRVRSDSSLLEAALRECEEEIALPRHAVETLGALDDTETVATQFVITPFVGVIREPVTWQPDGREIERVIEVPFAALADPRTLRVEHWERNGDHAAGVLLRLGR